MSEKNNKIEGLPALVYTALWQTREMGFLKNILTDLKIKNLRIMFFFKDYKPGALLEIDGEKGDYKVTAIDSSENIKYDGAIIGELGPIVKMLEGGFFRKGFKVLIKKKLILKGKLNLYKFLKILGRCAI
ncbi:MAG: hypothetical protein ACFFBP_01100 [Promethearchaeota archaeon]